MSPEKYLENLLLERSNRNKLYLMKIEELKGKAHSDKLNKEMLDNDLSFRSGYMTAVKFMRTSLNDILSSKRTGPKYQ